MGIYFYILYIIMNVNIYVYNVYIHMHIHIHTIYTYFFLLCYVSGFSTINLPATKRLGRFSLKVIFLLFSNTNELTKHVCYCKKLCIKLYQISAVFSLERQ